MEDIFGTDLSPIRSKKALICDMDGVIYHGERLVEGAAAFVDWLQRTGKKFIFLTNNSARTQKELQQRLARMGIDLEEGCFYTSALATASFLAAQRTGGSAYVIGDTGLVKALYDAGFSMNETNPDYVVVGETRAYSYEKIELAVRLVLRGARLIGTNPDTTGPGHDGVVPACKSLMAPIEVATGKQAYYIGKPNPLIMRHALASTGCHRSDTAIVGDRMDTDIVAGIESGMDTVLVLSGVTSRADIDKYPYRPAFVIPDVGAISDGR
jgi:NagD protein